jgi:outer membrane protein OmpA-like peptidoglycan-associated protein
MKAVKTIFIVLFFVFVQPAFSQNFNMTGFYDGTITFEEKPELAFRLTWEIVAAGEKFSGKAYIGAVNSKGHMTTEIEGTIAGDKITFIEKNVISQDKKPTFDRAFTKKRGILFVKGAGENFNISGKAFSLVFKEQRISINFSKLPHEFIKEGRKTIPNDEYLTVSDAEKIQAGKLAGKKIKFDHLIFDFNSATLKNPELLDALIDFLVQNPTVSVSVEGHTDNKGDPAHNKQLSVQRAKAVRDYLAAKGIDEKRIMFRGFGNEKNISEKDEENRRVEIVFL